MTREKIKTKTMWKIQGLEGSPKNDRNLYMSLEQAEMHAPVPSALLKVEVIQINYGWN